MTREKAIEMLKYNSNVIHRTIKAAYKMFTGKEIGEVVNRDMFEIEEIKEIADYLMVYYQSHINGGQGKSEAGNDD